uniref:Uncharacterized protein n=1 Tax=Setaria viridis TaxID=4556 RepID=A0A4U6SXF7_SETVI|nr:hypothetical protein SEVIR_9G181700v2 [Setaria viridis]
MSKPRALQDLMMAVEAGHVVDNDKLLAPRRSSSHGQGRKSAPIPAPAVAEACSDTSFEFSAVVSYSSASPASMVFLDGQLRAHQFPAVRSPSAAGTAGSSQAASPVRRRSASTGSSGAGAAGVTTTGSKKRVSFAEDGAAKAAAGGGQGKKSGGLLGCMGSACGSSRNEVVEPARNANRKVVAV